MRTTIGSLVAALLALAITSTAQAGPAARDPGVNARQRAQHARVAQGVRSGEVTPAETREIAKEQRSIRQEEKEFKADGKLTVEERKELHHDLNQASRN